MRPEELLLLLLLELDELLEDELGRGELEDGERKHFY